MLATVSPGTTMPDPAVATTGSQNSSARQGAKTHRIFTASSFAKAEELAKCFPKAKLEDVPYRPTFLWLLSFSSRSQVLMAQVALVFTALACNIALTVFAALKYPGNATFGVIYEGDCDTVGSLTLWLHLVINILSMGMLSGMHLSHFLFVWG